MSLRVGLLLCGQLVAVEDVKCVDSLMVPCWLVFAGIVGFIENTFCQRYLNWRCALRHFNQLNRWSFDLDALGIIVPIVRPCAVMLSVVTEVGAGWGCPIFSSVMWMEAACLHP